MSVNPTDFRKLLKGMFSPFRRDPQRRELKRARDWVQLGEKVRHYRRDVLSSEQSAELDRGIQLVRELIFEKDHPAPHALQEAIERLERILRRCGGRFYPRNFWTENTEMLLVAAILAIGIRTFFLQPFKIPTNSMYPTYHGLTYEIHEEPDVAPGAAMRALRFASLGSQTVTITAPGPGELLIPIFEDREERSVQSWGRGVPVRGSPVRGRKWFVIPATKAEYTLYVGNRPVSVQLPFDFTFDKLLREHFGDPSREQIQFVQGLGYVYRPGVRFDRGETMLSFEILTGDALFVDRFSYHFRRPEIGQPIVFRTEGIEAIPESKYYIKRLVGKPGDQLHIEEPVLHRNGEPITGSAVFDYNSRRKGRYPGYVPWERLADGRIVTVPAAQYFALGDNSPESSDSRHWGFVPEREVIGRAVLIYYPFSSRWGPAK